MVKMKDNQDASVLRPRRRRRRILPAAITLLIVAALGAYVSVALLSPLPAAVHSVQQPVVSVPAPAVFAVPVMGASAISLSGAEQYPATAGVDGILASSGGNDPRPIASITKLVTTLVILDAYPMGAGEDGPTITFTEADEDLYDQYYVLGASIQPMDAGSTMTLHDALELMLVTSATNYADAVSQWAFGSRGDFLSATNTWLAAHGLNSTTIVEPTGIDGGNQSSPTDLVALGKLAMANPVVAEITASGSLNVPGFAREPNTNTLLGEDGVNGLKTGTSDEAGSCLLFSAVLDVGEATPVTAVGVVLGAGTRTGLLAEVTALIDSVRAGFHQVPVIERGDLLGTYTTAWGEKAQAQAANPASLATFSDLPVDATVKLNAVTTAADGDRVGVATFTAGDNVVAVPIVLDSALTEPDGWWRMTHPAELFGW